jgi:Tol biopolymer transport system component
MNNMGHHLRQELFTNITIYNQSLWSVHPLERHSTMSLEAGARLGPYEILSALGAGGQGEVYRARDGRLAREVAIKILPEHLSEDPGALARFEREAKAVAALSHPNILAIHDFGKEGRKAFAVMELLEGETLRTKLQAGGIPVRKAVEYASQIARGLGAAHNRGVAHRDLKPENLFVTKDGRVKILDFGLARNDTAAVGRGGESHSPTATRLTEPGMVFGTVGYMAPEQVRGEAADSRSDIFAFGCVLYEMLGGGRAFHKATAAETMTAILKEDPPPLSETSAHVAPALEKILGRCLEKSPEERFRSADDIAFALEAASSSAGVAPIVPAPGRRNLLLGVTGGLALAAAGFFAGRIGNAPAAPQPSYGELTFERGTLLSARFAPDGDTIVYSAAWGDKPVEIFSTRVDFPESRSLGISNAKLLSVSPAGEMALLVRAEATFIYGMEGTLARSPIGGEAPREVLESVQEADWSPDDSQIAVIRYQGGLNRLEFPPGKALYETAGYLSDLRFSPRGNLIAFFDHPNTYDDRGSVATVDLYGRLTILSEGWEAGEGLAWSPDGSEIWFTAQKAGERAALYAVTLGGKERLILRTPGNARVLDVNRGGRALLSVDERRNEVLGLAPGEDRPRDLTYLGLSVPQMLSRDGKTVLLTYWGTGASPSYDVYLRGTDGSPPVRLGTGAAMALSPDGKWVASLVHGPDAEIVLLPTGPGETRRIHRHGLVSISFIDFHPDVRRLTFVAKGPGEAPRVFVQDIEGDAPPRAVSPPGYDSPWPSPDGTSVASRSSDGKWWLLPVDEGQKRLVPGLLDGEVVSAWSADSLALYVYRPERVNKVYRVDLETGARTLWREIAPLDPVGTQTVAVFVAPEANTYVLGTRRLLSELYLVEGLR